MLKLGLMLISEGCVLSHCRCILPFGVGRFDHLPRIIWVVDHLLPFRITCVAPILLGFVDHLPLFLNLLIAYFFSIQIIHVAPFAIPPNSYLFGADDAQIP